MSEETGKELTGRHVLYILLAFFGVMLAVNIYFTVMAVSSFRGEDVPRSYRQGLEYNQTIAARQTQSQLGWTAGVNHIDGRIIVEIRDIDGDVIRGLELDAKLRHPTDTSQDRPIIFTRDLSGRFTAELPVTQGKWLLKAVTQSGDNPFKFEYELWLS